MSDLERRALEASFASWKSERVPELPDSQAFELFTINLLFKDADLSDDDVASGLTGGGGDGGIDGIYFFINRQLMSRESDIPTNPQDAELWVIQAKNRNSFEEAPVEKIKDFINDLFDFSRSISSLTYYSQVVRDVISDFREQYTGIIGYPHKLSINLLYATKSDHLPSTGVMARVENVRRAAKAHISAAEPNFQFWGASELLEAYRNPPSRLAVLKVKNQISDTDGSFICLVPLAHFAEFMRDKQGNISQYMLEPNVRDYQGNVDVNRDIRVTLQSSDMREFWWLNNGITILADTADLGAQKLSIQGPQIVNGLQTSHEIFYNYASNTINENRTVLVRVILPPDETTRRRIIKATNFQNPVSELSLHSTEDIHFDIEELLALYGFYYDRRKGRSRQQKRPIAKIVSMKELAQAVMSIALWRPDDARVRPGTVLKRDEVYKETFDTSAPRDLFVSCISIDRQVNAYLSQKDEVTTDVRVDLRYYIGAVIGSYLTKKVRPTK